MNEDMLLNMAGEAVKVAIMLSGPLLIGAMVVGIIVSIFQAITQINEATLTFVPKMIVIIVVLAILSPWMLETLKDYAQNVLSVAGQNVR